MQITQFKSQPRFPILAPYGTVTTPQYSVAGSPTSGMYIASDNTTSITRGGTQVFYFGAGNAQIIGTTASLTIGSGVILQREADGILALRNSTNAQTFRVYNTYTDASNYERGAIDWASTANVLKIGAQALGTGTLRGVQLVGQTLSFRTTDTDRWTINSSGHLLAVADNTYDIGASGATRPRNVYVAGFGVFGSSVGAGVSAPFYWPSRSTIYSPSDGVILLQNNAASDFTRLQFGGTTSSFPALKRNGAALDFRLADDSAYATINTGAVVSSSTVFSVGAVYAYYTTGIPAGGSAGAGLKVSSTTNFGVFFGSGAPTLSAAKGSLYLRSDGSGVADRMYVNTDGSTTWTAVATVA
jgi:hypothetical protein